MVNWNALVRVQEELASRVLLGWEGGRVQTVAGADFSYGGRENRIAACVAVLRFPNLQVIEMAVAFRPLSLPYVPGFLSFREGPVFCDAYRKLTHKPDITLVDGNGIAHPRRLGLASYVGVLLDIPTIGCAKTPFFPARLPSEKRGAWTVLRDRQGKRVGFCLRTREGVAPVYVSPGHRVDFGTARRIVLRCSRFRIPEPIRLAHQGAGEAFSRA